MEMGVKERVILDKVYFYQRISTIVNIRYS